MKEEMIKEKGLQKATEEYIDAIYYYNMYNSSGCWKSANEVNRGLRQLQTKKDKYESIKENINIRVKGFGWTQFHQSWSKDGKQHSVEFLAEKLKFIIKQERKLSIPDKPPINIPKRKKLPTLGKQTVVLENLDKNYIKDEEGFVRNTDTIRKERERILEWAVCTLRYNLGIGQKLTIHLLVRGSKFSLCLTFLIEMNQKRH